MTLLRLISPSLRSGLMTLAGAGLIAAPFAFELDPAALVFGVAVGSLAVALGLAGTDTGGRGTIPVSAQAVYDRGLATGLLLAAVVFGLAGQEAALAVFAAAGLVALLVSSVTRYSANPA